MIFEAIKFACQAHEGHFRKGTNIPYISHLTNVMKILLEYGYDEEVAVAGLLHDTVEDTPVTIEQVEAKFGAKVAHLVKGATEPSKLNHREGEEEAPWKERKSHTIDYVGREQDEAILALALADKLDNIRAIARDYRRVGDAIWDRFNAPYEQQNWYYYSLAEAFLSRQEEFGEEYRTLTEEFSEAVREMFP
ncbi:HD domain-containing protein [Litoribacter alkaliphilus]|uniref:HD domain-containing protein n=1 Tax=Litoribacter ruber TaxID=702568 RepID=A0AAP2G5C7_9BACT|nr:HD domain-containing protein [Litoribacter alkaliphilus]MBS9525395.1 HD domain-containing protein [Litoribacter alkaliphilus]